MCDMQKMPTREDGSREEEEEEEEEMNLNFAAFSSAASGVTGTHYVTTSGHVPVTKLQQGVQANGASMSQVVGMVGSDGGVQYVRTLEGGAALSALSATPQIINLPISLPGSKPGDPQPTVQIQVLAPNMLQQQQPKYQMQIPIQGFQQGGAVLTFAYSPENELQLLGNMPEGPFRIRSGLQLVTMNQDSMQLIQPSQLDNKDVIQQQLLLSQAQLGDATKDNNNHIIIKQECDENTNDDENSQETETTSDSSNWMGNSGQEIFNYINKLPQQQNQSLPTSLQQYLRLNVGEVKSDEVDMAGHSTDDNKDNILTDQVEDESTPAKKKKKYKKKPAKPNKPKPGQVVIATATDGTPIFCCPECQMAYPEKEQLELHLSVHKIERRFICGICGAGLKRKEHLERHKLGHNPERPYVCAVCRKGFKRREHLNLHTVIHSGVKTELCLECGKGFYRKDHLRKHARSHESKRQRESALAVENGTNTTLPVVEAAEITIHVPTSENVQVPVQINIPQHVVSSLQAQQAALLGPLSQQLVTQQQKVTQQRIIAQQQIVTQQQQQTTSNAQIQLEALLQQHT